MTLTDLLRRRAADARPPAGLFFRNPRGWSRTPWPEFWETARAAAAALVAAGVGPGDRVGLWAGNSFGWLAADAAAVLAGAVTVPVHAGTPPAEAADQLARTGTRWLFADEAALPGVPAVRERVPSLTGVVCLPGVGSPEHATPWLDFLLPAYERAGAFDAELDRRAAALTPDTPATVLFTSGTTGEASGVVLTHGNLVFNAQAQQQALPFEPGGILLSWLPLSHVYGRVSDWVQTLVTGVPAAFCTSPDAVLKAVREVKPAYLYGVPRFYEAAAARFPTPAELREAFGPNVRWLRVGGAPLPRAVLDAYAAAGLLLLPGYGLTETSPSVAFNRPGASKPGTVGKPLPGVDVRVAEDGELLTRGPHVMAGYWDDPAATAAAIRDGWFHTGDLGEIDADGFLTVTGRKKGVIALSTGKKVSPEKVEALLTAQPEIGQAVVFGDGRPYLVALVVPRGGDVAAAVEKACAGLAPWERVGRHAVLPRPLSAEAGELTVSLKPRRGVIAERYAAEVAGLYD